MSRNRRDDVDLNDFTVTVSSIPTDQELDWDDLKTAQTALSKIGGRQRRAYGRRAHTSSTSTLSSSTQFSRLDDVKDDGSKVDIAHFGRLSRANSLPEQRRSTETQIENENAHPNVSNSETSTPKKPFGSTSGGPITCFSSISRSVPSRNIGYGAYRSRSASSANIGDSKTDISIIPECLTPTPTYSFTSRKRGVCDSPIVFADEMSANGGLSVSRNSTSSYGSSRRSRSRIFSPVSTHKMMEAVEFKSEDIIDVDIPIETSIRNKNDESFQESDSDNDDNSVKSMAMNTTFDDSNSNEDMNQSRLEELPGFTGKSILPPTKPRRMSSTENTFAQAIFEPVEVAPNHHSRVFKHMSSYDDLKFLIRELRKWKSGKQSFGFGMTKTCTVVPPKVWKYERKAAFILWTTSKLGFSQRSGGGMVTYIQTTQAKGSQVLKDLETALLSFKESCKKDEKVLYNKNTEQERLPMSSIKISSRTLATPTLPSFRSSLNRRGPTPMSIDKSSPYSDMISDLSSKLGDLNVHNDVTSNMDISSKVEAEISRIVTLNADDNFILQGRPSLESALMNNSDFMNQMHALTPRCNQGNDAFQRQPNSIPCDIGGKRNSFIELGMFSPAIQSTLNFDGSETPMPQVSKGRWNSQPISGFDWGDSEKCEEHILRLLYRKFEERRSSSGRFPIMNNLSPPLFSSVSTEVLMVRASSIALGIDREVESYGSKVRDLDSDSVDQLSESPEDEFPSFENFDIQEHSIPLKQQKRREKSLAKRNRMSICVSAMGSPRPLRLSSIHGKKSFANLDPKMRSFRTQFEPLTESTSFFSPTICVESSKQVQEALELDSVLLHIFSFLNEKDLLLHASTICTRWADVATDALANLMLISVGCSTSLHDDKASEDDMDGSSVKGTDNVKVEINSVAKSIERSWEFLCTNFPRASFLSEGSFKRVYKVWNQSVGKEEAISVMDLNSIDDATIIGSELAVSVMLSSLTRRNICPNFVLIRGVFTSRFQPLESQWGSSEMKCPQGNSFSRETYKIPEYPCDGNGSFQYIRMELCKHGDVEEYIKRQPGKYLHPDDARNLLFQMAFSLHVAKDRFGLKHYDIKLLNFFLQDTNDSSVNAVDYPYTVLRYGLGSHIFNLRTPTSRAVVAKLADFGTANTLSESNGQPIMINNLTTLENTPPDYMILGDAAVQGHGHDSFGLGLCMLHLFTGEAPYEEIMESVRCPSNLKAKLAAIWESEKVKGYEVIKNVVLGDIYEDEDGNIDGEKDETLYDTLYRYLVLFGLPQEKFQIRDGSRVWKAVEFCLGPITPSVPQQGTSRRSKRLITTDDGCSGGLDHDQFTKDQRLFSIKIGKNEAISRARNALMRMDGGMDLLFSLTSFDPSKRFNALDVMNSKFMAPLRHENMPLSSDDKIYQFMAYLTK